MRILFFGDSITQGFWSIDGGWVEKIRKHYDGISMQDLDNNVQPEIFNLGISGDTTRNLLKRIDAEVLARKWKEDPLIVVIAIGTNDDLFESNEQWVKPEEFRTNLEKILSKVSPITTAVMFVGNPACDESKTSPVSWGDFTYTNRELERSEKTIAELANSQGFSFVPIFDGFKTKLDAGEDLLMDGLHPNDAGHKYIADCVLPELDLLIDRFAAKG
jgi:lysophospholipase L1-like esterase